MKFRASISERASPNSLFAIFEQPGPERQATMSTIRWVRLEALGPRSTGPSNSYDSWWVFVSFPPRENLRETARRRVRSKPHHAHSPRRPLHLETVAWVSVYPKRCPGESPTLGGRLGERGPEFLNGLRISDTLVADWPLIFNRPRSSRDFSRAGGRISPWRPCLQSLDCARSSHSGWLSLERLDSKAPHSGPAE